MSYSKLTNTLSLKNTLTTVPNVILSVLRLLISISPLTNLLIKIRLLFMRMPIRIVIYTIHNVI